MSTFRLFAALASVELVVFLVAPSAVAEAMTAAERSETHSEREALIRAADRDEIEEDPAGPAVALAAIVRTYR